jgi:hypothetical protein
MPGGFPKESLSHFLADTRWSRCASVKENASVNRQTVPWHWNPQVGIALAPGISVHKHGIGYAHGGLSPQESIVPRLTVRSGDASTRRPEIGDIEWRGLRCRVLVFNAKSGLTVDLRQKPADPSSSVAFRAKSVAEDGTASIAIPDPALEGDEATVVLLRGEDIIDTYPVTVGRHE